MDIATILNNVQVTILSDRGVLLWWSVGNIGIRKCLGKTIHTSPHEVERNFATMALSERKAALHNAVLDTAETIIIERGLSALKARDVAQQAGCSLGAIYTVFADLDSLILAVNARTLARLEQRLASYPKPPSLSAETIETWLVALSGIYLDFAAENRLAWRALFEFRMAEGQTLPEEQRARHHVLFGFIEYPLAALGIEPEQEARSALARSLFSAVHGIVVLGLEEKLARMSIETLHEQIAIIVKAAIRGLLAK